MRNIALIFLCVMTIAGVCQIAGIGVPAITSPVISASASPENSSTENSSSDNFDMENSSPENTTPEGGIEESVSPEATITPGDTAGPANATEIVGSGEPVGNETSVDLTNSTDAGSPDSPGNSSAILGNETGGVLGGGGSGSGAIMEENLTDASPGVVVTTPQETPAVETTVNVSVLPETGEQEQSNPILAFFNDIFKGFRYITGMY
ncbi:MAG: hypothetical protein LUO88_02845 [Methanoregulaceae archaeon]|nr:hypothetical protein [Methanoregulaceae archaeon]